MFLSTKFHAKGDAADLERVVELRREILNLRPPSHPDHALSLCELAVSLSDRFDQRAATDDIEEAIRLTLSALELRPLGHRDQAATLKNLAFYRQKKISKPTPKVDPDGLKSLVMDAVRDTLESLPPRLLNTPTGTLCDRDGMISEFENRLEYKQLLSLATTFPTPQRDGHIREVVSTYFQYVTLSHRWGKDEPLLRYIQGQPIYNMDPTDGLLKLQSFCAIACEQGYLWGWSDTCCIDKTALSNWQEL